MGKALFDAKERACRILSYAAWTVNRFHAQDLIEKAENQGIDPMLEDLLRKNNLLIALGKHEGKPKRVNKNGLPQRIQTDSRPIP